MFMSIKTWRTYFLSSYFDFAQVPLYYFCVLSCIYQSLLLISPVGWSPPHVLLKQRKISQLVKYFKLMWYQNRTGSRSKPKFFTYIYTSNNWGMLYLIIPKKIITCTTVICVWRRKNGFQRNEKGSSNHNRGCAVTIHLNHEEQKGENSAWYNQRGGERC